MAVSDPGLHWLAVLAVWAGVSMLGWALVCLLVEPHEPDQEPPALLVDPELWLEGEEFFDFPRPTKSAGASPERPPARDTEVARA